MSEGSPRRWLLISRELGVPDEEAANRWAVDHLFVDQDGVPTLVEVKRSSDTRIRREVVGQMLDYAANAVAYWPVDRLRGAFEARCARYQRSANEVVAAFLGAGAPNTEAVDAFWAQVGTNLRAGRPRLIFAADQIPAELRRIVEFLNSQMNPAEVLAVEVRRFVGDGQSTLVPKVIGYTAASDRGAVGAARRDTPWTADEFIQQLAASRSAEEVSAAKRVIAWARARGLDELGGTGGKIASVAFRITLPESRRELEPVYLYAGSPRGILYLQIRSMGPSFQGAENRAELSAALRERAGLEVDTSKEYPGIPLSELLEPAKMERLLGVLDWVLERIREEDRGAEPSLHSD